MNRIGFHQILLQAQNALRSGRFDDAQSLLAGVLKNSPGNSPALQLQASVKRAQGRKAEAVTLLDKALDAGAPRAELYNRLGNWFSEDGDMDKACDAYRKAVSADAGFADAWFNWGLALKDSGRLPDAFEKLQTAIRLCSGMARYYNAFGVVQRDMGDMDGAKASFLDAIVLQADNFRAHYNMGVLLRMQQKSEDAVPYLQKAVSLAPRSAEARYVLANAFYDIGRFDAADEAYRTVLALKPDYVDAHLSLNKMYWETGRQTLYGKSYAVSIGAAPHSAPLRAAQTGDLLKAGRVEEALTAVEQGLSDLGTVPDLLRHHGLVLATMGQGKAALASYEKALEATPHDTGLLTDCARLLIHMGIYDRAGATLDRLANIVPFDQQMWAYRGLVWRLSGDEQRDAWLNDYHSFVQPMTLEPPGEYASLDSFLDDLKGALRALHKTSVHPVDQTLRGGTQTLGQLLDRPEPVFVALRDQLSRLVSAYIDSLPSEADWTRKTGRSEYGPHPLLSRICGQFRFSASWSVRLGKDGFHVNHVHPMGWISSAFYVEIGEGVLGDSADMPAGWIKFGESGLDLGPGREKIRRLIRPEEGLLALFPSYMWHGTVAHENDAPRMTAPFDVVPV